MKINVRQKDIDNGIGGDGNECPIALATRRAFNTHNVEVFYNSFSGNEDDSNIIKLRIEVDNKNYSYSHIDKIEHLDNFIYWFDNDLLDCATPFKFNIDTHA
jgi:hypothetical protein